MGSMTRWLDVEVGTDDIDLNTLPSNIALVDLQNDNEIKLLIGDFGRGEEEPKLKIFRGAMQISDIVLPDWPLGVVGLYTNESTAKSLPLIAIAFSSSIFLYRNLKLFYKYHLPAFELSTSELETWKKLVNPENHTAELLEPLIESLNAIPQNVLSVQSKELMSMSSEQRLEYLEQMPKVPSRSVAEIVCITTLKVSSVDRYSATSLVIASEDGEVFVLDPHKFVQVAQAKICSIKKTPFQMIATGLYNVDYRITVATREKCVCLLKRDWSEGRLLFTTADHIISIEVMPTDNSILVISADNTLESYSKKGKKQWSLTLDHRPVCMTMLPILHLGVTLTGVALASGHVYLYDGMAKRDSLFVRDVASVMKFGQLGQEEHVFIIVTAGGNLSIKILKRTADFNAQTACVDLGSNVNAVQKPWLIPKKSKLFLEQSIRERDNAVAMHECFQHELVKLRLQAAKTLLEAHVKSDNSIGIGALEPVRLSAEVEGLGPMFKVTLMVENTSKEKAIIGLSILFHVNNTDYKVYNPYIKIPLLSPGAKLSFPTRIEEIFTDNINPEVFFRTVSGEGGQRSLVKVLLLKEGQSRPVLAAVVQMPPTDPMMLPIDKLQTAAFDEDFVK